MRSTLTASQIEFVNLIVNYLTEHGVMDAALSAALRVAVHRRDAEGAGWAVHLEAGGCADGRAGAGAWNSGGSVRECHVLG